MYITKKICYKAWIWIIEKLKNINDLLYKLTISLDLSIPIGQIYLYIPYIGNRLLRNIKTDILW
jgi:hypothetical protein